MAGIYIHIPFCRQACRYCDFYFTVSLKYRDDYVEALLVELKQRRTNLQNERIDTIYLGGGTPSILSAGQIDRILKTVFSIYPINPDPEVTIEANPDDLNDDYLKSIRNIGFNRISIGIQSFRAKDLELMRRSHNAEQALLSVEKAKKNGFDNINIDLIYGLPDLSLEDWENNIRMALDLPIQHISAYHLTYEPGTVFHHWKNKGRISELPEELSINQFQILTDLCKEHGFEHYEISNFAKAGFRSKHNSTYWKGINYLGFGPSAHSFNGLERRWNVSSIKHYIEKTKNGEPYYEREELSPKDRYHDYLLTSLRTIEGASLEYIKSTFGERVYNHLMSSASDFISGGEMFIEMDTLKMTTGGWLKSDLIIEKFMLTEDLT